MTDLDTAWLRHALSGTLSGDESPTATLRPALTTLSGALAEDPAPPVPSAPLTALEFEVVREVGRGGMGIVYQATQRSLRRPVALKTLAAHAAAAPAATERFAAEAFVTGRLDHPNIPPVYAYGIDDAARPYLAMKLVKGVAWSALLDPKDEALRVRAAALDLRAHLDILRRVSDAVAFAHSRGVIHRDLKPENVMIGEFGEVLVMDWGLALDLEARDGAPPPPAAAGPARPVGTPAYLAPEMALGNESAAGPWTDIYLLGGILYEVLTGAPPHAGESVLEAILEASGGEVEPPARRAPGRKIPEALAAIAMVALAREPENRYQSVLAFAGAIEEYLHHETSVVLADAALTELAAADEDAARKTGPARATYERLAVAVAGLREALSIWKENRVAVAGLTRARLSYAAFAVEQGDLALVEAQLAEVPPGTPGLEAARARLAAALALRASAERRRRRLIAGALLALALAAAGGVAALRETRVVKKVEAASAVRQAAVLATEGAAFSESSERVRKWEQAVAIDPTWDEAQAELGRAHMWRAQRVSVEKGTKDLEEAVAPLDRAVAIAPGNAEVRAIRAYLREIRGDWPGALEDYRAVAALSPESHVGHVAATEIALGEGRIEDAVAAASKAIEPPGGTEAIDFFRRAIARYAAGDLEGARKDAEKAHVLSPRDTFAEAVQAMISLARGERRAAAEKIHGGLKVYKRSPPLVGLVAYLAAKSGDLERARALVEEVKDVRRQHAACFLAIDPCWRAATLAPGKPGEIARAFTDDLDPAAIAPAEPAPSVRLRRRGEERFVKGEVEGAFADAARVLADDPLDGVAALLAGRCLAALGQPDAARSTLALVDVLAPECAAAAQEVLKGLPADKKH